MGHGTHAFFFFSLLLFSYFFAMMVSSLTYLTGVYGTRNRSLSVSYELRLDRTMRACKTAGHCTSSIHPKLIHSLLLTRASAAPSDTGVRHGRESRDSFSGPHER